MNDDTKKNHRILVLIIISLNLIATFSNAQSQKHPEANCRPSFDKNQTQYIVGYGSLMQEDSKKEDAATVGENQPIYVTDFERGWIEHGTDIGFSTTYLGVTQKIGAKLNAVYFKLNNSADLRNYDNREDTYCRVRILPKYIQTIKDSLPIGQYWIYTTKSTRKNLPSRRYPLVQSYIDIFLSGCLQLEEKFHLKNFARDCVKTTSNWSNNWTNDRIHPRTAFDNIPYVAKIDRLLAKELPKQFKQIKLE